MKFYIRLIFIIIFSLISNISLSHEFGLIQKLSLSNDERAIQYIHRGKLEGHQCHIQNILKFHSFIPKINLKLEIR